MSRPSAAPCHTLGPLPVKGLWSGSFCCCYFSAVAAVAVWLLLGLLLLLLLLFVCCCDLLLLLLWSCHCCLIVAAAFEPLLIQVQLFHSCSFAAAAAETAPGTPMTAVISSCMFNESQFDCFGVGLHDASVAAMYSILQVCRFVIDINFHIISVSRKSFITN